MSFFAELRRRNVVRMAALYAIASWVILQVADLLFEAMELPASSVRLVVAILLLGFPLVLVFSWVYELTPDGLKREKHVDRSKSIVDKTARKLDVVIIILLIVAIGGLIADRFAPERATETSGRQNASIVHSIAVLPFVNISDDATNEYFSDGLSEELLNLLARIPELRVAARTSSFSFKNEKVDIATIAQQLNVAHLLEGSVRKSGNQVRITAQLIKADDGFHLWSQSFDRTLDNIFEVQDEIAAAVVDSLKIEILGETPTAKAINAQAYELYLRGRYLKNKYTETDRLLALQVLEESLAIEPNFAPTWVEIWFVRFNQGNFGEMPQHEAERYARAAAERALALDSQLAEAHVAMSWTLALYDYDWPAAAASSRRAIELEPDNPTALRNMGYLRMTAGQYQGALEAFEHAYRLDPLNLESNRYLVMALNGLGRYREAELAARRAIELDPEYYRSLFNLGVALLMSGDATAALREFVRIETPILKKFGTALALHDLGPTEDADAALDKMIQDHEQTAAFQIAILYAVRGNKELAFEWLEKAYAYRDPGVSFTRGAILLRSLHGDPRWDAYLERVGLSDKHLAGVEF